MYANVHNRSWVEPSRLLLPTGKIERLYALVLVSHIQWSAGVKSTKKFSLAFVDFTVLGY